MKIGFPTEIKDGENRLLLTPETLKAMLEAGHDIILQRDAPDGIKIPIEDFEKIAAEVSDGGSLTVVDTMEEVYEQAKMIVMVKEPQKEVLDKGLIRPDHIIFDYLHLAGDKELTERLLETGATFIALETVTSDIPGDLPLLRPMSLVAGKYAIDKAEEMLQSHNGGPGVFLGGIEGVPGENVVIVGAGSAGEAGFVEAYSRGVSKITLLEKDLEKAQALVERNRHHAVDHHNVEIEILDSNEENLRAAMKESYVVISAVLTPGGTAPVLFSKQMLKEWAQEKPGGILVDIPVDQAGSIEREEDGKPRTTSHDEPFYTIGEGDNVIRVMATQNMPGDVARTASIALTNVVTPHVIDIANKGFQQALIDNEHLRNGLNIIGDGKNRGSGKVVYYAVARDLNLIEDYQSPEQSLGLAGGPQITEASIEQMQIDIEARQRS